MSQIPIPSELPLGRDGRFTLPWRTWLASLENTSTDDSAALIEELARHLGSPDGSIESIPPAADPGNIFGNDSVKVIGTLSNGFVFLTLVNDSPNPGNTYYYGTGPDGTKGWFAVADAFAAGTNVTLDTDPNTGVTTINATGDSTVPYFVPDGETFSVAEYKQALFTLPIELGVGSSIDLSGALVEVN